MKMRITAKFPYSVKRFLKNLGRFVSGLLLLSVGLGLVYFTVVERSLKQWYFLSFSWLPIPIPLPIVGALIFLCGISITGEVIMRGRGLWILIGITILFALIPGVTDYFSHLFSEFYYFALLSALFAPYGVNAVWLFFFLLWVFFFILWLIGGHRRR